MRFNILINVFIKKPIITVLLTSALLFNLSCYESGNDLVPPENAGKSRPEITAETEKELLKENAKLKGAPGCPRYYVGSYEKFWAKVQISKTTQIQGNQICEIITYHDQWAVYDRYREYQYKDDLGVCYDEYYWDYYVRAYYKDPYTEKGSCCDRRPCKTNTCIKCSKNSCK